VISPFCSENNCRYVVYRFEIDLESLDSRKDLLQSGRRTPNQPDGHWKMHDACQENWAGRKSTRGYRKILRFNNLQIHANRADRKTVNLAGVEVAKA
jgi:hypothetical protein